MSTSGLTQARRFVTPRRVSLRFHECPALLGQRINQSQCTNISSIPFRNGTSCAICDSPWRICKICLDENIRPPNIVRYKGYCDYHLPSELRKEQIGKEEELLENPTLFTFWRERCIFDFAGRTLSVDGEQLKIIEIRIRMLECAIKAYPNIVRHDELGFRFPPTSKQHPLSYRSTILMKLRDQLDGALVGLSRCIYTIKGTGMKFRREPDEA